MKFISIKVLLCYATFSYELNMKYSFAHPPVWRVHRLLFWLYNNALLLGAVPSIKLIVYFIGHSKLDFQPRLRRPKGSTDTFWISTLPLVAFATLICGTGR